MANKHTIHISTFLLNCTWKYLFINSVYMDYRVFMYSVYMDYGVFIYCVLFWATGPKYPRSLASTGFRSAYDEAAVLLYLHDPYTPHTRTQKSCKGCKAPLQTDHFFTDSSSLDNAQNLTIYCIPACLICLSVCLSVCLAIWLSVWLSVYLSVWLSVCLSGCMSVCLTVCLSGYLSDLLIYSLLSWFLGNKIYAFWQTVLFPFTDKNIFFLDPATHLPELIYTIYE